MIEAPLKLSPEAAEEWDRLVAGKDDLTDLDRGVLAAYCQAHGRWQQAELAIAEMARRDPITSGLMIKTQAGNAVENPLVGIAKRAMLDMARYRAALSGVFSPNGAEPSRPAGSLAVNQAEFARLHGVSRKTVTKWKTEGRLVLTLVGDVDVDATDARLREAGLGKFRSPEHAEPTNEAAKRRYTLAQAELKELELAERRGLMVSVEDVVPVLAEELADLRSRLMAMPGRLAVQVAAEADAAAVERIITDEISSALREITCDTGILPAPRLTAPGEP